MGLDMYLTKHIWYGGNYKKDGEQTLSFVGPFATEHNIDSREVEEIVLKSAYWRKANAIHGWFVDNCGEGLDNCQEMRIDWSQLSELYDLCKKTLAAYNDGNFAICKDLLPPAEGFFFGSYKIDDWYKEDLKNTINQLSSILENSDGDKYDYFYKASW